MIAQPVETVGSKLNVIKLGLAILIGVSAIVAYYGLAKFGAVAQWGGLLVGLAVAVAIFAVSDYGRQLYAFTQDSVKEMKKVVWPTRKETVQMTLYVFGFVVIMAMFLWLSDKLLAWLFYDLILGWRK